MLTDTQVHQSLEGALPQDVRPDVIRRLRRQPALWSALHDDAFLRKAISFAGADPNRWKPGLLGLLRASEVEFLQACISPDRTGFPVLSSETRQKAAAAKTVVAENSHPAADQAALAALALAEQTEGECGISRQEKSVLASWYSITPDPKAVLLGLANDLPASSESLIYVLTANEDTDRATELLGELIPTLRLEQAAAVCDAAWRAGEETLARRAAGMAARGFLPGSADEASPSAHAVRARMFRLAGETASAAPEADAARLGARRQLDQALRESARTAEAEHNFTAALSFWQEAGSVASSAADFRAGIARALTGLGRENEALAALAAADDPQSLLAAAQILNRTGAHDPAMETARRAYTKCGPDSDPRLELDIADALTDGGDPRSASQVLASLSRRMPAYSPVFARLADTSAKINDWRTCHEAAAAAFQMDPENTAVLRLLAESALRDGEAVEAAGHFRNLSVKLPDDPSAWIHLAQASLSAGDRDEAKSAALRALELNANAGEAHAVLGQLALVDGDGDAAFASLQKATRLSPAATAPWKALAELHLAHGNRDAAVTTLRAGAESAEDPASLLLMLGRTLQRNGMLREAAAALGHAAQLQPDDPAILVALAEALLSQDQLVEAESRLTHALEVDPANETAGRLLSDILSKAGKVEQARGILEQALAANPQSRGLLTELGALLLGAYRSAGMGDPQTLSAAVSALRQASALPAGAADPRLQALTGWANIYSGELADAVALFGGLLRNMETLALDARVDAYRGLAEALLRSGDYATAVSNLQSALQLKPGDESIRQRLGEALSAAGLSEDAREVFRLILSDIPGDLNALTGLSEALAALGREDEAVAALRQAAEGSPANALLWIRLAESQFKAGANAEAHAAVSHAVEAAGSQNADIALRAGRLLGAMNDPAGAETVLAQSLAQNPAHIILLSEWAFLQRSAGRHEKAFDAFRRAAELEPENPEHLRNAAESLWDEGRKSAAIAFLKKAAQAAPQNVQLLRRLASALTTIGLSRESLPWYEQALAGAPGDTGLALEAAQAALRAGDLEKADAWTDGGADPKNPSADGLVIQTRIALEKGDSTRAAEICRRLVSAYPEDSRGWALLARTACAGSRESDGEAVTARDALAKALALGEQSAEGLALTGAACLQLEDHAGAVRCLETLCAASPDDPEAHTLLARARIQHAEAAHREEPAGAGNKPPQAAAPAAADSVRASLSRAAALGADEDALQPLFLRAALAFSHPDPESIAPLEAVNDENPSAETGTAISQAWLRAGDAVRARRAAESAVSLAPESAPARTQLAVCEWKNGRRETALSQLSDASSAAPHLGLPHAVAAWILAELERPAEARREMEQAVLAEPEHAAWQYTLGRWNEEAGETAAALPRLQRAADLDPQNGEYQLNLAHALARDGDAHGALVHYRQAAALLPASDSSLPAAIGRAALESGSYAEAYDAFQKAIEQSGDSAPFAWPLGKARAALALGRREEARTLAKNVLAGKGRPPEARLILAEVDESEGRLQEAIRHLDQAASEMGDLVVPALRLARLWTATGNAARAETALDALIEAHPENDEARHLQAEALLALGRTEESLRAGQKAADLSPRNAGHWILLGQIARKLGQLDQSLEALARAREIAPTDVRTALEMGLTYEAEQRWDLALDTYRTALRPAPDNAELLYRLGVVHKNLRSYAEAAAALRRAIQIEPHHLAAHKLLSGVMALNLVYGAQDKPMDAR